MSISLSAQELILRALPLTIGIEEKGGPNAGRAVERIQATTGNRKGDAWCASHVATVGHHMLGSAWKLPLTASCDVLLRFARQKKILSDTAVPAAVFLVLKNENDAIHTGFVVAVGPNELVTNEGNTNPDGGREGYGVFKRVRKPSAKLKYIHWWKL